MSDRNFRKGAAWGYGLGLLSLLAAVALMFWMFGKSAGIYTGSDGQSHSSYQQAIDRTNSVLQAATQRGWNEANAPGATTAPATPEPGTGR
jgi:hypothetical protein